MIKNIFKNEKKISIGVHIGQNELRLARVDNASSQKPVLSDSRAVPFESNLSINSPQFFQFLRKALTDFCGAQSGHQMHIWSLFPASSVDTRYIKIPKVPAKQIANAVYWTYRRETPFNDDDVVFDYQRIGEISDNGVSKLEFIAYTAPRQEIQAQKALFEKSGFQLSGITIFPFVFQNFMKKRWIEPAHSDICSIFIGMDWTGISIFSHGQLMVFRSIRTGMNGMLQAIMEETHEDMAPSVTISMPDEDGEAQSDEKNGFRDMDTAQAFETLMSLSQAASAVSQAAQQKEIFTNIRPVLERLVGQVERTLKHYALNFGQKSIGTLYLSGAVSSCRPLVDYISAQLEIPVETFDPLTAMNVKTHRSSLKTATDADHHRIFLPASGLALSKAEETPNFLHTYQDKIQQHQIRVLNRTLAGSFLGVMAVCGTLFAFQQYSLEKKASRQAYLRQQLESNGPAVDQARILRQVARIKKQKQLLSEQAEKYYCPAIIHELTAFTPSDIRLIRVDIDLAAVSKRTDDSSSKMAVEGIILGNRQQFETILAEYVFGLKQSPLFGNFRVENRSVEFFLNKEVLRFKGYLELI